MSVRVGMIGTGWVAQDRHLPSFAALPTAELVAVYDRDQGRAAAAARRFGVPRAVDRLEDLLRMGLDVVSIATPPWTHGELANAAFESGAHVFLEKPMAMNLAEAQEIVAAAEAAGRLLCVSHNFRFSRAVAAAHRFLGENARPQYALGMQVSSLRRRLPDWYERLPGGLLFDEVPHLVYLMRHFLGDLEVEHVRARWADPPRSEPSSAEVLLSGVHGPGQITMVFDAPLSEWQVLLTCRDGVVLLDLFRDIAVRLGPDGAHRPLDVLRTSANALLDHGAGFVTSGARYVAGRQRWGHDVLIRRFVRAVAEGAPSPVSAEEALGVVGVVDGILAGLRPEVAVR